MNSDFLILDEPTTGLDRDSEILVLNMINKLKLSGCTIVLSTHSDLISKGCDIALNVQTLASFEKL